MSSRPEILFPLFAEIDSLRGVGPKVAKALSAIDVSRPRDLLFTLPHSVVDRRKRETVKGARPSQIVTVEATINRHWLPGKRGQPHRVEVADSQTVFTLVFFRGDAQYLQELLPTGQRRIVSGKIDIYDGRIQMAHPDYALPVGGAEEIPEFEPLYPLTAGVSQKVMRKAAAAALERATDLDEWIDPGQKAKAGWPDWREALARAHAPDGEGTQAQIARQRLVYDELMAHQLTLGLARTKMRRSAGRSTAGDRRLRDKALAALPFKPTVAQSRAMAEIEADMAEERRMNRLLQGDVGSGKTLVAFNALLAGVEAGGQGALMAPTGILARQHHATLLPLAQAAGVSIEILTSQDRGAARKRKLEALAEGGIDILLGTQAVFQDDVAFADLRVAVVDEQHRFGVQQRLELGRKGAGVDVLVMTATPIPRSMALAQFGDMDVSVLNEKPPGRRSIKTAIIGMDSLEKVIARLREAIAEGRQAYWVCPLVEESEALKTFANAEARHAALRDALGADAVGLVHGQMPVEERDAAMEAFREGRTSVLVATTVIEVGMDVAAASIMVIESAERFGLAQLHQLRGRVGRADAESSCVLLCGQTLSGTAKRRLETIRGTEDGFKIAEEDLRTRGSGDLIGTVQSGLPKFRIADLAANGDLLDIAQSDARTLLHNDPDLESARGRAARTLLWLMERDQAIRLIKVG